MRLDYESKLRVEELLLVVPLSRHWMGQQWYSEDFPPGSWVLVGCNNIFGIAEVVDGEGTPSYVGIMDIKPHLEKIGGLEEKARRAYLMDAINHSMGNFDRYGGDTKMFSSAECMIEVTDGRELDADWFYHKHEANERRLKDLGVQVVKVPFTSTPVKDDDPTRN